MKRLSIFFAALILSVGYVFAAEDIVASWTFTSDAYPKNTTNFNATDGTWKTNSVFYLNGNGSTWNTNRGYAFTAVTDITITVTAGTDIPKGAALKLEATTAYNKATNAPMTGFNIACKVNDGTAATIGVSSKNWALTTTTTAYNVTYTTQQDLQQGAAISFVLTQTGKVGAGQGFINNISVTYAAEGGTTEPVAVESVALDKAELSIEAGKTATLVATITPDNATNKKVTWATDNDKVATVANGVVTAVAEGKANITVTTEDGEKTATCAVTVTPVPAIDGMNYSVDLGTTAGYKTWTVDNKSLSTGLTRVWTCDASNKYAKASAFVNKKNLAAEAWLVSPKLDLSKAEVAVMTINHALNFLKNNPNPLSVQGTKDGETWVELEVNGWPTTDSWTFVDATIDLTPVISANTQIAFVYKSNTTVAPTWEIKTVAIKGSEAVHATEIKLDKETLEVEQYKNIQLTATLAPAEATDLVEWASDNQEVATVSATGVVTAVGLGTANITATAGTVSAKCVVTVKEATPITCAEAATAANGVVVNLNTVEVVYVSGQNIYIQDASGALLIYDKNNALKGLVAGNRIKGFVGTSSPYSGLPELVPTIQLKDLAITEGTIPAPTVFTTVPTKSDLNKYLTIKGVRFDNDYKAYKSRTNANVLVGETKMVVRNNFTIDFGDLMKAYTYDITGFVAIYSGTIQFYPTEITPQYTIIVTVNDDAMGTVEGAGTYKEGTEITLTATPKEGYKFMSWTVGEETNMENPLTITVTEDMTITANFAKDAATAIDDINAEGVVAEKVVRDGQVLIIRDGKTYNMMGQIVE